MRFLFTFVGRSGHFLPHVGVARASISAGHEVAFACSPSMVDAVTAAGFVAIRLGDGPVIEPKQLPLKPVDLQGEARDFKERFIVQAIDKVDLMAKTIRDWKPDVLVYEETDFGSPLAAEMEGIPCAMMIVLAAGSFGPPEVFQRPLSELRYAANLPPNENHSPELVLAPIPPSFRDPRYPLLKSTTYFRQPAEGPLDGCPHFPTDQPLVYVTLGTVFNLESGDLFSRILSGLQDLPINVLVTVGKHLDPTSFRDLPDNVQVHRFIPQDAILPHCSLVVSHAGSGSTIGSLAYGLPSVLIPLGADQPVNAIRCQQLGCALVEDPIALTPESIRQAVLEVLSNPSYRAAAEGLMHEYRALPDASQAVSALESLAK